MYIYIDVHIELITFPYIYDADQITEYYTFTSARVIYKIGKYNMLTDVSPAPACGTQSSTLYEYGTMYKFRMFADALGCVFPHDRYIYPGSIIYNANCTIYVNSF